MVTTPQELIAAKKNNIYLANDIDMNGADFIGYILAGSQSGSPKDYAKSSGASYATLFEGINKFPNETSEYSSNVQEYNEELIVNFISEFLRIYIN